MDNYLLKYKGTYRIMAEINQATNDFPRNKDGAIDADDLYIKCRHGNKVFHYGHNILEAYIPSRIRAPRIISKIQEECGDDVIFDCYINDVEGGFKFKTKDLESVIRYLDPMTSGAGISPFSSRNLPKREYVIPESDLQKYNDISEKVDKNDKLIIYRITQDFLSTILAKKPMYKNKNIAAEMKLQMLKNKEFIHNSGFWNEYIEYLRTKINNGI